nr:hypothetical protein [Tanacetum cinerariifolium]GEY65623.1 hypothetical protein [Tanacetum cinerariifolium]
MVGFLSKPTESDGFEQIVDFLNARPIRYALTVNSTIYISCIEQFWSTAMAKTINGEVHIHARVDGKEVVITESSVRRDLQLADKEGIDCLPNSTIFKQLTLMGIGKGFSGRLTSLFLTMVVQNQTELGEGLAMLTGPHHTPTILQPSSYQPQKTHKPRKPKRNDTQVPQPSGSTESVADEAVHKKLSDSLVRAATTASSLEAEQDSESSRDEESLGEDVSKQRRRIDVINEDEDITLVNVQDDAKMFDVNDLGCKEEERLTREKAQKEQEANIALIKTWDDIQAKIDADHQLVERLQAQKQEELSNVKNATLFKQLLEKRRKHFAAKRS